MAARSTWTAPSNGGATITDYRLERKRGTGAFTRVNAAGTALTYLDTGAVNGDIYRVAATNSAGTGPYSTERTYVDPGAGGGGGGGGTVTPNLWASPSGNDSTGTGSQANPFRSLNRLAQALGAGQVGGVVSGTYDSGSAGSYVIDLSSGMSGTQSAPKRLVGGAQIGQPTRPIVRGYVRHDASFFNLEGMYFDLAFRFTSSNVTPFRVGGSSGHGQAIRDCEITGGNTLAQGILIGGGSNPCNNVQVTGTIIHDIVGPSSSGPGHGIYHQNGSGLLVQGCVIYRIGVQSTYGGCRAIQIYPASNAAQIRYNTIDENIAGIVWGNFGESGTSSNHIIEFNIGSNEASSLSNDGRDFYTATGTSGNTIRSPHHHNITPGSPAGTSYAGTTTTQDPLYVNRGARNYRLQSGSPAAGKGAYAAPTPPLTAS